MSVVDLPTPVPVSADRVDVALVALDDLDAGDVAGVLTAPERAHALRRRSDAARWAASRIALRRLLGDALDVPPSEVPIVVDATGRPRLGPGAPADIRFSVSRSGPVGLLAVRLAHDVGVDVEIVRDGVDGDRVAEVHFRDDERAALRRFQAEDARSAFFRAWVRHEAVAKVLGRGIVQPVAAGEAAAFAVRELCGPGLEAAVASEGSCWCLRVAVDGALGARRPADISRDGRDEAVHPI